MAETEPVSCEEDDTSTDDDCESEVEYWVGPYCSAHRILLVGDGDFSFSLALAKSFRSASNLVATSIDKRDDLEKKYSDGGQNVRDLEDMGGLVLLGIDATKMSEHFFLKTQRFDRIVYNFPHVGFQYREASYCQILLNKTLVQEFFRNAMALTKSGKGEIHVTHKEGEPYDKWDLVTMAKDKGLLLLEVSPFNKHIYPGYNQKRAHGKDPDAPFRLGNCKTYKFKPQPPMYTPSDF
uniref:25S rRNA (uridine-N(3))-methyltransferase BMT5-like domain-containing protein n=1 Tax=Kalanchoe fedtschenkoi TaxID=63787 RepID=A0A7N0UK61_KALFE